MNPRESGELPIPTDGKLGPFLFENFQRLAEVPADAVKGALANGEVNPETGIIIVRDVAPAYDVNGVMHGIHAAEVPSGGVVRVHVHDEQNPPEQGGDLETYLVLGVGEDGEGESGVMSTGKELRRDTGVVLGMNPDILVTAGTKLVIFPGTAHELHGPATILFSCPDSHLNTDNRRFLDELPRVPLGVESPIGVAVSRPESPVVE